MLTNPDRRVIEPSMIPRNCLKLNPITNLDRSRSFKCSSLHHFEKRKWFNGFEFFTFCAHPLCFILIRLWLKLKELFHVLQFVFYFELMQIAPLKLLSFKTVILESCDGAARLKNLNVNKIITLIHSTAKIGNEAENAHKFYSTTFHVVFFQRLFATTVSNEFKRQVGNITFPPSWMNVIQW